LSKKQHDVLSVVAVSTPSGDGITADPVEEHCAVNIHQIKWLYHNLAFIPMSAYVLIVSTTDLGRVYHKLLQME
ncbi:hypothetical protein A2U01_0093584, partial [Trifolium medium]|nr:hypothetical protein [Trifolium medium]